MAKQEFNDKDIARAWQKLADEKFSTSQINKQEIMNAIKLESHSSITELKKRVKYKLYWSAGFILLFATTLMFRLGNNDLVLLLGIGTAAYIAGFIPMYLKYRQIDNDAPESGEILESMKYNVRMVKSVLKLEKTWGLIIFTPAILMGILGGRVIDGWTLAACFQDPKILLTALIAIIIFTPLLIWVSDKMNKYAFGDYLKKLENNIIKMETLQ